MAKRTTATKPITKSLKPKKELVQQKPKKNLRANIPPFIFETAWEVCNQVGGIYTVIRSKTPAMTSLYGSNFMLIGPYVGKEIEAELISPLDLQFRFHSGIPGYVILIRG